MQPSPVTPTADAAPRRGRGRPTLYPNSLRYSIQIENGMADRIAAQISLRENLTPFVREALAYYLDALEAGRVQRPGR